MTSHISEELPRLLTGEAGRAEVDAAAVHLRVCEDCQQELVSAVVAHASLTSAQRFAPELVALFRDSAEDDATLGAVPELSAMPDLSGMFTQIRAEAEAAPVAHRSNRRLYAVVAAAAAVVVGGGTALVVANTGSTPASHTVALSAFGVGHTSAKATFTGSDAVKVNATSLPTLDEKHRYEVWLTNDERTLMQPVGWLGNDGKASLTVPKTLAKKYTDIEVSVQSLDASTYTYSGTSVLRGDYAA